MLSTRVSSSGRGTVVLALGGQPPDAPLVWRELAPCSLERTVGPRCLTALVPLGYRVTTNPNPFPTTCMRGDVYVAPGLPYGNRRR